MLAADTTAYKMDSISSAGGVDGVCVCVRVCVCACTPSRVLTCWHRCFPHCVSCSRVYETIHCSRPTLSPLFARDADSADVLQ